VALPAELGAGREDVGGGLVETAGLTAVGEVGGDRGDAVGHLVGGDVQRGQRVGVARTVAVGHAEAGVVPERVDVRVAVVDTAVGALAVVLDAAAVEGVLEEVPGDLGSVGGVHTGGLVGRRAGGGAGAPGVVGVGEEGAGAGRAAGQVVRLVAAAGGVGQLVRGPGQGGPEGDRAAVEALAGAGLDVLGLVQLLTGQGVRDDVQAAGGAVVLEALDDGLPGEAGRALAGPDDLAGGVGLRRGLAVVRLGGLDRLRLGGRPRDLLGGGGHRDGALVVQGDAQRPALVLAGVRRGVDDQVAAEDRQTRVAPLVTGVQCPVVVPDDVLDEELLLATEPELPGVVVRLGLGVLDQRGALGGRDVGGECGGAQRRGLGCGVRLGGGGQSGHADGHQRGRGHQAGGRGAAAEGSLSHAVSCPFAATGGGLRGCGSGATMTA
jgi:hypothetical protein